MTLSKELLNHLFRYALSLERDPDRAYDLLQSAIEKYLGARTDDVDKPMAYIKRIIRNLMIDRLRHVENRVFSELSHDWQEPAVSLDGKSLESYKLYDEDLELLLQQLTPQEREFLFLWAVEGYTIEEIAALQEVSKGTLLSRLHRLRARIRANNPELAAELRGG